MTLYLQDDVIYKKMDEMVNQFTDKGDFYFEIINRILDNLHKQLTQKVMKIRNLPWDSFDDWGIAIQFLLKCIDVPVFSNRFINTCRESFENYLESVEDSELELIAGKHDITVSYDRENQIFRAQLFEFTKYCSRISGSEYRLVFQSFDRGEILIEKNAVVKLLRETLASNLREMTSIIDKSRAVEIFRSQTEKIEEIRNMAVEMSKSTELGSVDSSCFPPCIIHFISDVKGGVNLPHLARFTMVSFLNNVGMSEQGIIEIFGTVPDFSKKITEYQVRHIIGEISGIKYSPPKCVTLRSNHLCYWDDDFLCHEERMTHPLTYYKIKKKNQKRN
ncbi:MAG: hypothetical protein ACYCSO_04620 [Cuniculiplasma sp.]